MALQDYARLAVYMDASLLEQITSLHITWTSGNQRVDLLNTGLSGFTPGSGECTIEIGIAVPAGGTEEPFQQKMVNKEFVTMQVPIGREDYIGNGKIDTVSMSQSVNGSLEGTVTWIGEVVPLQ